MLSKVYEMTKEKQAIIFSNNLKKQIQKTGRDQKDIANDMGINAPTFNQWVTGVAIPALHKIQQLADYFSCTVSELVDESPVDGVLIKLSPEEFHIMKEYQEADAMTKAFVERILKYSCHIMEVERNGKENEK